MQEKKPNIKHHSAHYRGRSICAKPTFSEDGKFLGWQGEVLYKSSYEPGVISDYPYKSPEEALAFCREEVDEDINFFLF